MIEDNSNIQELLQIKNRIKILESHRKWGVTESDYMQLKHLQLKTQYDKSNQLLQKLNRTIEGVEDAYKEIKFISLFIDYSQYNNRTQTSSNQFTENDVKIN